MTGSVGSRAITTDRAQWSPTPARPVSATYAGATLNDVGLIPGTYNWAWGSGSNGDSVTVTVVPEPHEYAMAAGLGLVGIGLWRRHARK